MSRTVFIVVICGFVLVVLLTRLIYEAGTADAWKEVAIERGKIVDKLLEKK